MDNEYIAELLDYQNTIEKDLQKLDKKLSEYSSADYSSKTVIKRDVQKRLKSIKTNISIMRKESASLKLEENISKINEVIEELEEKYKSAKQKFIEIESRNSGEKPDEVDPLDININIDKKKYNSEQLMQRGDKILNADAKAITNMKKVVYGDIDQMKDVNKELDRQNEKLNEVDDNLKDIDYSLEHAGKKVRDMFRIYSKDKLVICMIGFILVIILIIIILAAVGKDKDGKFNVPHDIFSNGNKTKT